VKAIELSSQIRNTVEASREAVRRAHERAVDVQQRAQQIRDSMRARDSLRDSIGRQLARAEQQSVRAERESQRFVAIVSHELRQPLNAAMAALSMLEANPSSAASDRAHIILRRQLLHMATLLGDLLDLSRLALRTIRIARVPVDLRRVLQDAVDAIDATAQNAGVQVACSLAGAPVPAFADPARLQQAFSNLLTNGVRYTPGGGRLDVSLIRKDSVAEITVQDTGQGIPQEDLASIFEPFWRGHDSAGDGFGIGLALVRGIIEVHDGTIAAFSDGPGTGARFCITLPISES